VGSAVGAIHFAFWNTNGKRFAAFEEEGIIGQHLAQHHVVALCETISLSGQELQLLFPQHSVFVQPAIRGRRGYGLAVLVKHGWCTVPPKVLPQFCSSQHHVITVLLESSLWGQAGPVAVVSCYVPHSRSPQLDDLPLIDRISFLTQTCIALRHDGYEVILGGDFNAQVQGLGHTRDNEAGTLLHSMCENADLSLLTGAVDGDRHVPHSCVKYHKGALAGSSRVDHVLCSTNIAPHVHQLHVMQSVTGSDHYPFGM
jgi:exonuclease III